MKQFQARSNEEYIMVAYLLGWSGDWSKMVKALNKRYKRLKDRKSRQLLNAA